MTECIPVIKNSQDLIEFYKGVLNISGEMNTAIHLKTLSESMGVEEKNYFKEVSKDTHTINDINVNFELPIFLNYEPVSDLIDSYVISVGKLYSTLEGPTIEKFAIDIKINDESTSYLLNIQIRIALPKTDFLKSIYEQQERLHLY